MENFTADILVLAVALLFIALILGGTVWSGVPPMPTSRRIRQAMLEMLDDETPAMIYELGAGWGGMATALADKFPQARVIAVEISPLPWLVCWLRQVAFGPRNLSVRWGNALKTNLHDADLVVCFLCPQVMVPLDTKLMEALKPGTLVLSNSFSLPNWKPIKDSRMDDRHRSMIYLYRR